MPLQRVFVWEEANSQQIATLAQNQSPYWANVTSVGPSVKQQRTNVRYFSGKAVPVMFGSANHLTVAELDVRSVCCE